MTLAELLQYKSNRSAVACFMLHGLEQKGYLRSWEERNGRSRRRLFRATPKGHQALRAARIKIRELFTEIVGGE